MGLFDSGGKGNSRAQTSSATSTNTSQETYNTVDNRAVQGDGAVFGGNVTVTGSQGGPLTISTTDQGAVAAGLDVALESLAGVRGLVEANASIAKDSISQAYGLANQARQSETSGAINNALKYFAVIAVIGIAAWAYSRRRG